MPNEVGSNKTTKELKDFLNARKRHRWEPMRFNRLKTTLRSHLGSDELDEKEFLDFFKKLEQEGCGQIMMSKLGNPKAFKWSEPITKLKNFIRDNQKYTNTEPRIERDVNNKTIIALINDQDVIRIELPKNMDEKAKQKLAKLILST